MPLSLPNAVLPSTPPIVATVVHDNVIEPIDSRGAWGASAVTANQAYLTLFRVPKPMLAASMTCFVAAAAGNIDMGIFTTNAAYTTLTLVASTGAVAAAGTNVVQTIALTASYWLQPGIDYFVGVSGSSTVQLGRVSSNANGASFFAKTSLTKAALHPLATFSTPSLNIYIPWLAVS